MNDLKFGFTGVVVLALLTTSIKVKAQQANTTQQSDIEVIVVTADPLGNVDDHMIQPTEILDSEELRRRSIQSIGETVSEELGVTSSDFGAGVGRPVIRGMSGGRVKVLENSISSMDASTISNDHAVTTEPVFAEQIEILRGPATLLYGSGASGGLVNVVSNKIPRDMPDGIEAGAVIQYETVNEGFTGSGEFNGGSGGFALHLSGMKRDTKDYDIPGFADAHHGEEEEHHDEEEEEEEEVAGILENSSTDTESVTGGLAFMNDTGSIGFSISGLNSLYGIPGHHHHEEEEEEEHHEEEGGVTTDMEQVRYDFAALLLEPFSGIREIKTRWGYNDYEHVEIEPSGEIGTSFSNEELEGRIEIIHDPIGSGHWDGALGIQINSRDFSAVGEEAFLPPAEQDAIAVFLVEKADIDQWHVDLGIRYEDQDSESITGDTASHGLFSIGGGASYDYGDNYELGLSVGYNQRGPAIEELFSNGPHAASNSFEVGNTALGDESSTNIDLHWHKKEGNFQFKVNLFYNLIDDFIYLQEQDLNNDGFADRVEEDFSGDVSESLDPDEDEEPLLLFHTQNDAEFRGFELEGTVNLFNSEKGNLDLRAWTDYVDAELKDGGGNLPRISPWRIGAGLDYRNGPWDLNLDLIHTAKQNDTAALEEATPGYNMLNLYIAYYFDFGNSSFTLFARGTNLLNEEARRHTSVVKDIAPLPGRSGIIGLRALF